MSIDEPHVALPTLYGAPAYARPPSVATAATPRPFDPDELPLEIDRTDEERELATMTAMQDGSGNADGGPGDRERSRLGLHPRDLRGIAGRLLGS